MVRRLRYARGGFELVVQVTLRYFRLPELGEVQTVTALLFARKMFSSARENIERRFPAGNLHRLTCVHIHR